MICTDSRKNLNITFFTIACKYIFFSRKSTVFIFLEKKKKHLFDIREDEELVFDYL